MDATGRIISEGQHSNIKKSDIILKLKVMDGEKPKSSMGMVDTRLFTGENKLHAIMDTQTCLWHLKYDNGILPNPFKQQFTNYTKLIHFVTDYFKRRNVEIEEIID